MRRGIALLVIASIILLSHAPHADAAPMKDVSLEAKQQQLGWPFARSLLKVLGLAQNSEPASGAFEQTHPENLATVGSAEQAGAGADRSTSGQQAAAPQLSATQDNSGTTKNADLDLQDAQEASAAQQEPALVKQTPGQPVTLTAASLTHFRQKDTHQLPATASHMAPGSVAKGPSDAQGGKDSQSFLESVLIPPASHKKQADGTVAAAPSGDKQAQQEGRADVKLSREAHRDVAAIQLNSGRHPVQPLYVHQPILQEAPDSKARTYQGGQPRAAAPYYTSNGYGYAGRQRSGSADRPGEKFAHVEAVKRGVAPGYFHDNEAEHDSELPQAVVQYPFNVEDGGPDNNAKDAPQYPPQRKYRDSKPEYPPQGNYGGPGYQGTPQYPNKGNYGGPDYRDNKPLYPYPGKYGGGPDYKDIPGPEMPKLPMQPRYDAPRGEGPHGIDEVRNNYERFQHEYYSLQRPAEGPRDKHVPYDELLHRYDSLRHEFEAMKQKLGRSDDNPKQDMDNGKALNDLKNMYDSMKKMYEDIQKKDIEQQLSEMKQKYEKLLKEDKATDKKTQSTEESDNAEDDDQETADSDDDDNKPKKHNIYNDDESKSDEEYDGEDGGDEDSKSSKQGRSKAKGNKGLRDKDSKRKESKEEELSVFKNGPPVGYEQKGYKKDDDYEGYPDKENQYYKEPDDQEHRRKDHDKKAYEDAPNSMPLHRGDDGPAWDHQPDNRPPHRDNRPYEGPHGKDLPPTEDKPYAEPPRDVPPPQEGPYGERPRDGEPPRGPKRHRRRPRFNYASMNNTGSYVDPADPYLVADPKCNMDFTPFYDQAEYKFACLSEVFRKTLSGSDPYRPTSIQSVLSCCDSQDNMDYPVGDVSRDTLSVEPDNQCVLNITYFEKAQLCPDGLCVGKITATCNLEKPCHATKGPLAFCLHGVVKAKPAKIKVDIPPGSNITSNSYDQYGGDTYLPGVALIAYIPSASGPGHSYKSAAKVLFKYVINWYNMDSGSVLPGPNRETEVITPGTQLEVGKHAKLPMVEPGTYGLFVKHGYYPDEEGDVYGPEYSKGPIGYGDYVSGSPYGPDPSPHDGFAPNTPHPSKHHQKHKAGPKTPGHTKN